MFFHELDVDQMEMQSIDFCNTVTIGRFGEFLANIVRFISEIFLLTYLVNIVNNNKNNKQTKILLLC